MDYSKIDTYCTGKGCILRDNCFRYTLRMDKYPVFNKPPFDLDLEKGVFDCNMFFGEHQEYVLDYLNEIIE